MSIKIPPKGKVIVVGDIHEHTEQLDRLLSAVTLSPEMILVSVGDIYEKGFGTQAAETIVNKFRVLSKMGLAYVVVGNQELKCIHLAKRNKKMTKCLSWLNKQPISITFEFYNRTRLVVLHGGIKPTHKMEDLYTDVEICYVRNLDKHNNLIKNNSSKGKIWLELYDGRFGYIASGHNAQKDGAPKFYNYSCNLDLAVYHTGRLGAQIFSAAGKENFLMFEGQAKYPGSD